MRLDVDDLLGWEVELDDWDAGLAEGGEEADFGGLEEEEGAALAVGTTSGTSDAVDVVSWIIRWVELDNPVYVGDLSIRSVCENSYGVKRWKRTSRPLAATSVQIRVPCLALQNSKKVFVRFCCFCFP